MSDKNLQKYYFRLATDGVLKALLLGLTIGFGALTILGGLYWLMGWESVWICLVVWGVISAGATCAFYYTIFKPTTKYIAHRVDNLGLHERILTMTELEGNETYIAQRQRQDALEALETVRPELLKIGVSLRTIIMSAASAVLGIGMTVVAFLSASGVLKSGQSLINPEQPKGTYTVTYIVQDGCEGEILGETIQVVTEGEKASAVIAMNAENWAFQQWSDGLLDPYREDVVTENKTYSAIFVKVVDGNMRDLNEDKPDDAPGGNSDQSGKPEPGPSDGSQEAPEGKDDGSGKVIDNQTDYEKEYDEYYEDVMGELSGEAYEKNDKDIVGGYFDNIEKDKEDKDENNN